MPAYPSLASSGPYRGQVGVDGLLGGLTENIGGHFERQEDLLGEGPQLGEQRLLGGQAGLVTSQAVLEQLAGKVALGDKDLRVREVKVPLPREQEGRLLVPEDLGGHVDQLLEGAGDVGGALAAADFRAEAVDAPADVHVDGGGVLIRDTKRVLEPTEEQGQGFSATAPGPSGGRCQKHPEGGWGVQLEAGFTSGSARPRRLRGAGCPRSGGPS